MKSIGLISIFTILISAASPMGLAENTKPTPEATPSSKYDNYDRYWQKLSDKFDFGTENFLIGWTAILTEPADHYDKEMPWTKRTGHLLAGLGLGFLNFGLNTTGGFLNILTAPVPQFKIPLPKNGVDVKRVAG